MKVAYNPDVPETKEFVKICTPFLYQNAPEVVAVTVKRSFVVYVCPTGKTVGPVLL